MDEPFEELVVDVRAATDGFAGDMAKLRNTFDTTLLDGFERAGGILERGLTSAIRKGSLGFDDLKRAAFRAFDQIAAQAIQAGIGSLFGGSTGSGGLLGGLLSSSIGALFGLPGRATGGPVSPGSAYVVGERGPEIFLPTSSGRVLNDGQSTSVPRDVRVAIQLSSPRGSTVPKALQRSSRQLASAVRHALNEV